MISIASIIPNEQNKISHVFWVILEKFCIKAIWSKSGYQSHLYIYAFCDTAHSSKVHSPLEPLSGWVGKENMAHIYSSITESLKKSCNLQKNGWNWNLHVKLK